MIIWLDIVMQRVQAYRHLLFNRWQPTVVFPRMCILGACGFLLEAGHSPRPLTRSTYEGTQRCFVKGH